MNQRFLYLIGSILFSYFATELFTRKAMTVIYMNRDMHLKNPENDGQQNAWDTWYSGAELGEITDSPINLALYERT